MRKFLRILRYLFFVLFPVLLLSPSTVSAASISVTGKASVLNTANSYLDFTNYNSNVVIDNSTGNFSGYAFLEDGGWVAFGTTDNVDGPVNVNLTTGVVTGKAKIINTNSNIDFTAYNSNVTVNTSTGVFSGFAFSEDVGWLNFTDTGVNTGGTALVSNSSSSSSSSNSSSSNPSAPTCGVQAPSSAPNLYAAVPQGNNAITLYFTDAQAPYDHYVLEYGTSADNYQYGADNIGGTGTRTSTVKGLSNGVTYYFRVRAGNGCATGNWSNEISAKTTSLFSTNNLAIVSSELKPSQITKETNSEKIACEVYTVKPNDILWNIAKNTLGSGEQFKELIAQNKEDYPSLATSNVLDVGWKLKINCGEKKQAKINEDTEQITKTYDVNVKVIDTEKKAVAGATVTMHSTPRTTKTNKDGIATFEDVEEGQHRVIIAYNGFEGEQSIHLTGDVKEFDLNIQVKPTNPFTNPLVLGIIGALVAVIAALLVLLKRKKVPPQAFSAN